MKVLFLGAFGQGALENSYLKHFRRLGMEIETYDINAPYYDSVGKSIFSKGLNKIYPGHFYKPINDQLLKKVEGKMYEVIIVFKGMVLYLETLQQLKNKTKILCCYNPDHPFNFYSTGSGNKNVLDSISIYDLYITYSENIKLALEKDFGVHSDVIPFGFDEEAEVYPNVSSPLSEKFIFIGAYDSIREKQLEGVVTNRLEVFGDEKWATRAKVNSKARQSFAGKPLYGQEYINTIATSAGVFNFLREQNLKEGSHNMRSFEVPGYGGLMLANRTLEQMSFFKDDEEAVFFDSEDELNDKMSFLEKNPSIVSKIKINARSKSLSAGYGYGNRAKQWKQLLDTLLQ